MDVECEVSAHATAAVTNGLGGAGEATAEDAEAVVVTNGLGGGREASAEQRSLEAYAAQYSGRTRLARLVFIAQRCGVEAIELAALRMAHDEAKACEDTPFYREAALRINGRLGPTHLLDQDWVDSVNHRAEQHKEILESELDFHKTSLHGESIRICYNDLGDFYYSHGRLTEAFKTYIKTEEYFSATEHVVQMCMKAILISVELGHNVRVLNFVSKAQGCQDPLSPSVIAKLQAVAGLARLGRKEYKLAAEEFLETGPELGSNYSEVIAAQDVATYGSLCALAFFNYSDIKMKVIENAKFGSFLSLFPEIRSLVNDFYYSQDKSCMKHLESLKPSLLVDIHLADHVEILYLLILQKLDYMASSYTATISELQWVTPTSSPAQNEAEGDPHVNSTEAQLNAMCNLILHPNFNDDAALLQSTQYKFVKSKELLQSLGEKIPNWVSRSQACALLLNAEMFVADSFETETRAIRWVDGQILVISNTKFSMLEVEFSNYTTTCKPLKEKKLKSKEDSPIDRFEMRGDIWARRRACLRDNSGFHLIQWRRTSRLRRVQVQQPQEASSQNDSNTLLKELHVTMKSLLEELKVNTKTATESGQLIAKSCQEVIEACKISATSTGTGIVN